MTLARIKRFVLLVLIAVPVVFGSLALHANSQVEGLQKNYAEQLNKQRQKEADCEALSPEKRQGTVLCTQEWLAMGASVAEEAIAAWRDDYELYKAIALYVPVGTLALYFAFWWVWFGRLTSAGL